MLDAPVSGGIGGAQAGTLTFMVGGTEAGFARGKPVLEAWARTSSMPAVPGAGQAVKICNNMMLGISCCGVSEAFVLAETRPRLAASSSTSPPPRPGQFWALTTYCPAPGPVPAAPSNRDYAPAAS